MRRDFRISRSSVAGMDDAALFWALIEPVWPHASVADADELRHIAAATPGQRALYVTTLFAREVDNGGLEQFFHNSSGLYAQSVREAFILLEAKEHQIAYESAISLFPGGKAPIDQARRIRAMKAIPNRNDVFHRLDEQLEDERRLWPFFRRYVEKHPEEFFKDDDMGSTK